MNLSPKVISSTIASAAVVVVLYAASLAGLDMPEAVAGAIVTLAVFAAGYLTRDARRASKS
jgi:hypothetical protein